MGSPIFQWAKYIYALSNTFLFSKMKTSLFLTLPFYRDFVLEGQRLLDPEGVERRRRHRLTRRLYCSLGPNYAIHVDQYDKLLPYGFGIHGAMDG